MSRRKQKQQQPAKQRSRPRNLRYRGQMFVLGSLLMFWCLYLVTWFVMVLQLDDYNPITNSPDGIKTVQKTENQEAWDGAVGDDYSTLPEVVDGFGDVNAPKTMQYFGEQSYNASTTVYVVTTQKPAELAINKDAVTEDGAGGFSWTKDNADIGLINVDNNKENWAILYPEDSDRLKEYIDNKGYSWYSITARSNDKTVIAKDKCGDLVKNIFGMKLDPARSKILYSGGYIFEQGGN